MSALDGLGPNPIAVLIAFGHDSLCSTHRGHDCNCPLGALNCVSGKTMVETSMELNPCSENPTPHSTLRSRSCSSLTAPRTNSSTGDD